MEAIRNRLPRVFDAVVTCPAGEPIGEAAAGGSGCRCRVEHSSVLAQENPSSLIAFCLNRDGYRECPTWQAEKQHIEEQRRFLGKSELVPRPRERPTMRPRRSGLRVPP